MADIASILASAPLLDLNQQQPQQPAQPFTWGAGGQRVSPEQLALQRGMAADRMQADFSPVGHWLEGAGRMANNWLGALDMRDVERGDAAQQAQRSSDIASILGEANADLAGGLSSGDPVVEELAMQALKGRAPASPKEYEFDALLRAGGLEPGSPEYQRLALGMASAKGDPFITSSLPGGGFYGGPQSGFMSALTGGGDPASGPAMPEWWNTLTPEEQGVIQRQGERRMGNRNIPQGSPLSGGPRVGEVVDGYRFRGGNPNDRNSWEQVR